MTEALPAAAPAAGPPRSNPPFSRRPPPRQELVRSTLVLVVANLLPLGGLGTFWTLAQVLFIYWAEAVIMLLFLVGRLWVYDRHRALLPIAIFGGLFGLFLAFYYVTLSEGLARLDLPTALRETWFAILALAASHGFSFAQYHLLDREAQEWEGSRQVFVFLKRVSQNQIVAVAGFFVFLVQDFNRDFFGILLPPLVVVAKTILDARGHWREHSGALDKEMLKALDEREERRLAKAAQRAKS